jgi:membrane-bound lytic murein transglycosylase A
MTRFLVGSWVCIVGILAGCSTPRVRMPPPPASPPPTSAPTPLEMPRSRWVPVGWGDLPGWGHDALAEAWPALLRNCARPKTTWVGICAELRPLASADPTRQQQWIEQRFQPMRVEAPDGRSQGLLTAYYEPLLQASRVRQPGFEVPLYAPPAELLRTRDSPPWYTRREIDTLPQAQAALRGKELAYLRDPVDAMVLHIQGSGRLQVREANGQVRSVRLSFAATNQHPYQSIGRWLLDRQLTQDASWPGIKSWLAANPQRRNELLWSNPRYVFFKEDPLLDPGSGPTGAQGVPLTAGRSIAVDPQSVPYGTPMWLVSQGAYPLRQLVVAQDTGSAIVGAVRADYFVGSGDEAGEVAGRMRQNLQLWALWPR